MDMAKVDGTFDWNDAADLERLTRIIMPYANERKNVLQSKSIRFAHYTSAEAGIQILRNQCVWLRNSLVMNDFSEVQHGQACLKAAWKSDLGERLRTFLNKWKSNLHKEIEAQFDARLQDQHLSSFLLSISEHGSDYDDEDRYGRLSMWRAYGGNTNIAFVFNNGPFTRPSRAWTVFTTPVLYADESLFTSEFEKLVHSVEDNEDFLRNLSPDMLVRTMVEVFHAAVLSTKHPGFHEEREWRIIHSPTLQPNPNLQSSIETIAGVLQRVYKIPFVNHPEADLTGATVPELLDRIIIGPTQYPWPIYESLVQELLNCGVKDAGGRVWISNVPLRR